ncbi:MULTISPECIES: type II restriction endonuclease [Thalassospira]|uniref:Restriction endonuclease type II EcoRII C-terminal domain-containing protein n=2 Tax=Thalassospira TaxID=168934 RepID=A0A367W390_9PROT|nr:MULTISPECIES: type II restriction endonuclease [Thalassospira]MDG4720189.1 type II restriction endonuclease [Thalassospira sp. FZY0004]RCK33043.1 hypothetical protein TH19_17830 [Thalassospira profundimaris]
MNLQGELNFDGLSSDTELLLRLFETSDRVLVKKLSNNDRDWARFPNKHQAGVYIPQEQREGGFFPELSVKERLDPEAKPIRESFFSTVWPQNGNEEKRSRLVHYTSKGPETHLTGLPKSLFCDLLPASFFLMAKQQRAGGTVFICMTIDSTSEEVAYLEDLLSLEPDFIVGEFDTGVVKQQEQEGILGFADQIVAAWQRGEIGLFAATSAKMPTTLELAHIARSKFMDIHRRKDINPFEMDCPGDALREISRSIEWDLFREYQRQERAVQLVRIVFGDEPKAFNAIEIMRRLTDALAEIDKLMLSASQQRKSRAGYSYEHHIEAMLGAALIPFEKQVVLENKKRPDFVLPSLSYAKRVKIENQQGLILSAKTTLRERWKQVEREKGDRDLYLTTVDENIPASTIEDMARINVQLVIPESLLSERKVAGLKNEYAGHPNVLTFKEFCENVVRPRMGFWK